MDGYGYGLWVLVVVNSAIFVLFAASFFHPRSCRDWRALGGFSAFIVALFADGYPLTIYLASGVLGDKLPLSHNGGHLWAEGRDTASVNGPVCVGKLICTGNGRVTFRNEEIDARRLKPRRSPAPVAVRAPRAPHRPIGKAPA